jgi:hypothetical protein
MSTGNPRPDLKKQGESSAQNKNNLSNRRDGSGNPTTLESDIMETTRRYPRTLQEAFPDKAEQAEWFYRPKKEIGVIGAFLWIIFISFIVGYALIWFE